MRSGTDSPAGLRPRLAALAAALACATPLPALQGTVTRYGADQGLPQLQVRAIAQDRDGFLWVGTAAGGLARYDGFEWRVEDSSTGLPGSEVNCLVADGDGVLYAGMTGGAARLEAGVWKTVYASADADEGAVTALIAEPGGHLWVGTQAGLARVEPGAPPRWLLREPVTALAAADGGVWIGTRAGLRRLRPGDRLASEPEGAPRGEVHALLPRADGTLWIVLADAPLAALEGGGLKTLPGADALGTRVGALLEIPGEDGVLVATADRGALRWRPGAAPEKLAAGSGQGGAGVRAIFSDREANLWFGTDNGLLKLTWTAFSTYAREEGIEPSDIFYGYAQGTDGRLWLAGDGALYRLDPGTERWARLPLAGALAGRHLNDVTVAPDGTVWLATSGGLAKVRGAAIEPVALPEKLSLVSIKALPGGALGLATRHAGLWLYRDGKLARVGAPVGETLSNLDLNGDGRLLASGDGWGVAAVDAEGRGELLAGPDRLPSPHVSHAMRDRRGRLWVSTERGAALLDGPGPPQVYDRKRGLPDNFVYWVGEDARGSLWFGTNRGVARLAREGGLTVFTGRDGLPGLECNDNGFFAAADGRVFISSAGVARYLDLPLEKRGGAVTATITRFAAGETEFPGADPALLPPRPDALDFRFTAATYRDEARTRFRYRVLGLGEGWTIAPPGLHEAQFGGLPAGDYAFEVVALAADGRESPPAARRFTIRPAWWETGRVRALALALLLAALALALRWRGRAQRARTERLEREVAQRTVELETANARLARMAVTDELTGLPNRRLLIDRAAEFYSAARRHGSPLTVLMADLDHFKRLNDTRGHAAGDEALRAAAEAMRETLRDIDVAGRWGGEEFLVIFPGETAEGARTAAERLRERVNRAIAALPALAGEPAPPTLSGGLASLKPGVESMAALLQAADRALYAAKSAGRNRISEA